MTWTLNGNVYNYRMTAEVACLNGPGDRQFTLSFPAWYLKSKGLIQQAAYQDVHFSFDGVAEVPGQVNGDLRSVTVDGAARPNGFTVIGIYYGNASVAAPTAPTPITWETGGTLVDNGFESGTLGAALANPPWTVTGTPTHAEYNHSNPRPMGGWREAWLQSGGVNNVSVTETVSAGMNANTAECRWWLRLPDTSSQRNIFDNGASNAVRGFYVAFFQNGTINIYTTQAGFTGYTQNAYTAVGSFFTNTWIQFRVVYNFTTKTFKLWKRASLLDAWYPLKASGASVYDIPCCGTPAASSGTVFNFGPNDQMWIDDLQYANLGITDVDNSANTRLLVECFPAQGEYTSQASETAKTGGRWYIWGNDLETLYLDSGVASAYRGGVNPVLMGTASAGTVLYHALIKHNESALPKGTVLSAALNLNIVSGSLAGTTTFKLHRFLNYGDATDATTYVRTGWQMQDSEGFPTWVTRFYNRITSYPVGGVAWLTPGAVNANEVNLADPAAPSLSLNPGFTPGYYAFNLPTSWLQDWFGDQYSQGCLLKQDTEAGANYVGYDNHMQLNSPVLEVVFSALSTSPLSPFKLTTDSYSYYATFPTQNRYVQIPSANEFPVQAVLNGDRMYDLFYYSPNTGRSCRFLKNLSPANLLRYTVPSTGMFYDPDDHRFWILCADQNDYLQLGYSRQYAPTNWTWVTTTVPVQRADMMPKNGIVHIVYGDSPGNIGLWYRTFTIAGGLSAATQLAQIAPAGAGRGVGVGGIGAADTIIPLNGESASGYPTWDVYKIDNEYVVGVNDVPNSRLTTCIRGVYGTTPAAHLANAAVTIQRLFFGYMSITHDAVKNCFHVTGTIATAFGYSKTFYLRHYYADLAGTWKFEDNSVAVLPLTQMTEHIMSRSVLCYGDGSLVNAEGDFLTVNQYSTDMTLAGNQVDTWAHKLPNVGATWANVDISNAAGYLVQANFSDGGGGVDALVGIDLSISKQTTRRQANSTDYGSSFGLPADIDVHTFAQSPNSMWSAGVSANRDKNGNLYAYATHYAWYGAVYVNNGLILPNIGTFYDFQIGGKSEVFGGRARDSQIGGKSEVFNG